MWCLLMLVASLLLLLVFKHLLLAGSCCIYLAAATVTWLCNCNASAAGYSLQRWLNQQTSALSMGSMRQQLQLVQYCIPAV
jgi:hypothetical protein